MGHDQRRLVLDMASLCAALGRIALALDRLARLAIVAGALIFAGDMVWRAFTQSGWFILLAAPAAVTAVFLIASFRDNPNLTLRTHRSKPRRQTGGG